MYSNPSTGVGAQNKDFGAGPEVQFLPWRRLLIIIRQSIISLVKGKEKVHTSQRPKWLELIPVSIALST